MNFRSAHRRRAWARLSRALRLCVACAALPVMLMAAPGFAACGRPGGRVQAVSVDQRLDIALSDGRTVRLGGLDAPSADRGAPEIANAAQDFLSRRLLGREADLILLAAPTDRWGRTIADLSLPDSAAGSAGSTAAALLAAGWARVRPEFETRGCAAERLVIEDGARRAALGIWRDPDFAVIQSSDSAELRRRDGRFVVVEGMVGRVGFARSRLYLELVPHDGPTIVIARKLEPALAREGRPVGALVGETIRARGALDDRFGPRIEVGEPAMIEIARRADASGEAAPHR
jgi:endonuclease YncB( thermonuclease family)